ncbi:MAG: DUF2461 domain-containing protein [Inquilinus sp.]|nr:DUF2461 domain-containing protein [Inquilinus sp.]
MSSFAGFPPAFFAFFRELAENNDREWFTANKQRYRDEVQTPIGAFIEAMAPKLAAISRHYVADPRPNGGSMFRIYRDVRFSKDKRPYKEHGACQFRHEGGRDVHAPGFYVHLAPDELFFGGGIWKPPRPDLENIRRAIAEDSAAWKKAAADKALVARFGQISGSGLKRPPRGFPADHPFIDDIKRESFFAMHRSEPKAAASPGFVDEVAATFRDATPLMRFLSTALGTAF